MLGCRVIRGDDGACEVFRNSAGEWGCSSGGSGMPLDAAGLALRLLGGPVPMANALGNCVMLSCRSILETMGVLLGVDNNPVVLLARGGSLFQLALTKSS